MCISICLDECAWCQGGQKKTDILKLEYRWLRATLWVLGPKPRTCARTSALNF